ncbi:hypothetical protein SAMN05216345_1267 [Cupriavidus sp. YR651]|uniref:DUF6429 family protein n=1 Tax=Cupriavidus sp. YR651 TaxID=1855315 RepID=UPI00087E9A45|nr:DUF6429 family protein [Cupriavidus sp. YR651]SDD97776.1 hypothetical protein SAMN05216345_1267 [Cupriavidus sp. YR651]
MKTVDIDAIDAVVLALLWLNLREQTGRAWKSLNWDALDRLYLKGMVGNPASHAKTVELTDIGLREAMRLAAQYFGWSSEE